jgi:cell division transport system permease protein
MRNFLHLSHRQSVRGSFVLESFGQPLMRALRNSRQTPVLCAAAVLTVAVSLTIVSVFSVLLVNIQNLTRLWSEQVQLVAYLDVLPAENKLQSILQGLHNLPEVEKATLITKDEAFGRFRARLGSDADLLNGLGPDFLPASLEITLNENSRTEAGVQTRTRVLKAGRNFSEFRYGQEWLERFEAFVRLLRIGGFALAGFLLFAALFIIANTIKLTLYARRDELEIMALVGATPFHIKLPFLIEGAVQGLFGGLLALIGTYMLFSLFLQQGLATLLLATGLRNIVFLPIPHMWLVVFSGMLLGIVGSILSLGRFVRVQG